MTEKPPSNAALRQPHERGAVPPELIELLVPPFKFGLWSGVSGTLLGVGGAIIKEVNPVTSGAMTGFHWFTLGTTYWFSRTMIFRGFGGDAQIEPSKKVAASALAGVPTGVMSGMANRGARAVPSQVLFWAVVCGGAQWGANIFVHRNASAADTEGGLLRSAWSPLKRLTDEEYLAKLDDKMLGLDADIALIDERIAVLKEKEAAERGNS